ncbi:MAG: CRISPR-associated endonuclease Cas1 [Saprospiraceae bacterium]
MQIVLDTSGLVLKIRNQSFLVEMAGAKKQISPKKITSIAVTANVLIDARAIKLAIKNQIPILFFDNIGKVKARLWSPYFESIATLRRGQIKFAESTKATEWMIGIFELKTTHQIQNLQWLKNRKPSKAVVLDSAISVLKGQLKRFETFEGQTIKECRAKMMGTEGFTAKVYWKAVSACTTEPYKFEKRTRRPATDAFNASLNYLYGMMYSIVEGGLFAAGLDPHLGIFHTDMYNKSTLSFDLIEPFRPWVDRLLLEQCFASNLNKSYFTKNQHGLFLNKNGKAVIIPLFNQFILSQRFFGEQRTIVKNHIYQLCGQLTKQIRFFMKENEPNLPEKFDDNIPF